MFSSNHRTLKLNENECKRVIKRLKLGLLCIQASTCEYFFPLFAYLWGEQLSCTSPRNLVSTEQLSSPSLGKVLRDCLMTTGRQVSTFTSNSDHLSPCVLG